MDAHNSERFLSIECTLLGYDEPFSALRFILDSQTACTLIHSVNTKMRIQWFIELKIRIL